LGAIAAILGFFGSGAAPALALSPANISTSFGASSVPFNGTTSLSYFIGNPNFGTGLTNLNFFDSLPYGLSAFGPVTNDCGGTLTVNSGSFNSSVGLSGGAVAAGDICEIDLTVAGRWSKVENNSVQVGSSAGTGNTATSSITVLPPATAERVYWGLDGVPFTISFEDVGQLIPAPTGGDLSTTGATANIPQGVALDPPAGRIFYSQPNTKTISYANLDGSGGGDLTISGVTVNGATGIAVDPNLGRIYWANHGVISYADLDGSNAHNLNTFGATAGDFSGLALDPGAGRIYFADRFSNKLSYVKLDDTGGADLPIAGGSGNPVEAPTGVAIDDATGQIYWTNEFGSIYTAGLDGSNPHPVGIIGKTVSDPKGVAIDPDAGLLFWGNDSDKTISSTGLSSPGGWDQDTPFTGNAYPVLLKAPVAAGAPAISGGSTTGSLLSCSAGNWASDVLAEHFYRSPETIAYQWKLNGADIGGATSSTHTAATAGTYTCSVTASNPAGSAGPQTSAPFNVADAPVSSSAPAPPAPTGQRAAALRKCKKKHGKARKRCKRRARLLPV
jgi:PKD domain-containing protein